MTDEPEEVEEEGEAEDDAPPLLTIALVDGDVSIPDYDLIAEALERFGVVALAWRNRGEELECLLASEAGFKWASIESIGKRPNVRAIQ